MAEITQKKSLKDVISVILTLQTQYSPNNTEAMRYRGNLVRNELPQLLAAHGSSFTPQFEKLGYSASIEGKDGIGRKAMSAWVRLYDKDMSPSATSGWYIVIHFSSKGDCFYLTLGCGATVFKGGSLVDVDDSDLAKNISWAKSICMGKSPLNNRFKDDVNLHGNHLSQQFEKAIAFAKKYHVTEFIEDTFSADLSTLSDMLLLIYEAERLGKAPFSESPELRELQAALSKTAHPNRKTATGQGRFLSQQEKKEVELHAMRIVRTELNRRGFKNIEDTSAKEPYDFTALKDDCEWLIEVKGTTSNSADSFLITANEFVTHHEHKGRTILAIVFDIELTRSGEISTASGGKLWIDIPWNPETWEFKPTAYSASRKIR